MEYSPLISIIIPIYNAGKYIERCLISILNQTYKNYELILVNDGSTDDSGLICQNYINDNSSILYFITKNEGSSNARNFGIQKAQGKYITFIDADDWIDPEYLQYFIDALNPTEHTLLVQGCLYEYSNGESFKEGANIYFASCWGNLFYRDFLLKNAIKFDSLMRLGEDTIFNLEYIKLVKDFKIINCNYYHYCINGDETSLTNSVTFESLMLFIDRLQNKLKEKYIQKNSFLFNFVQCHINEQIETAIYKIKQYDAISSSQLIPAYLVTLIIAKEEREIELLNYKFKKIRCSKAYRLGKFILRPFSFFRRTLQNNRICSH